MRGANVECDGLVWRIDVGMSSGVLDAPVAVLEIVQARAASLCRRPAPPPAPPSSRCAARCRAARWRPP